MWEDRHGWVWVNSQVWHISRSQPQPTLLTKKVSNGTTFPPSHPKAYGVSIYFPLPPRCLCCLPPLDPLLFMPSLILHISPFQINSLSNLFTYLSKYIAIRIFFWKKGYWNLKDGDDDLPLFESFTNLGLLDGALIIWEKNHIMLVSINYFIIIFICFMTFLGFSN